MSLTINYVSHTQYLSSVYVCIQTTKQFYCIDLSVLCNSLQNLKKNTKIPVLSSLRVPLVVVCQNGSKMFLWMDLRKLSSLFLQMFRPEKTVEICNMSTNESQKKEEPKSPTPVWAYTSKRQQFTFAAHGSPSSLRLCVHVSPKELNRIDRVALQQFIDASQGMKLVSLPRSNSASPTPFIIVISKGNSFNEEERLRELLTRLFQRLCLTTWFSTEATNGIFSSKNRFFV